MPEIVFLSIFEGTELGLTEIIFGITLLFHGV